jgi:PAS domain S-box-containing protein
MNKRPKILYLRYSPQMGGPLQDILNELSAEYECVSVHTRESYVQQLHEGRPDLVLAESGVHKVSGSGALKLVQALEQDIPFIFITREEKEEEAIELLKAGAADYIIKDKPGKLPYILYNQLGKLRERRVMEHELQEKARLYEQNLAGVFSTTIDGKIRSCNMAFAAILGYDSPEYLIGKKIGSLYLSEQELHQTFSILLEDGRVRNYENTLIKKDGEPVRLLINSYLIYDAVLGEEVCEGVIIDYTDVAQVLLNLDQENNQLIKRNRNLEQFTYVISHNLRAPLANIISITELLKDVDTGGEAAPLIKGLNTSILTMDSIIKDINHTLQVKDHQNYKKEVVSFQALMDEITFSINNLVIKECVQFWYNFQVPTLLTVRGYIYSVFYNLTLNSIKYRRKDENPFIRVSSRMEDDHVLLIFEDNGKGIDMEKNGSQVFGLYKRFDTTIDGKGMGLFMVKTQIEDLQGSISMESELGKGTKILIRLPMTEASSTELTIP